MIIVVSNIKGGSGKTTIAANLAILRAQNKSDVLLVDADTQASASDFASVRTEEEHQPKITCTSIHGKTIGAEIKKLTPKFGDIVVDVGGRDSSTLRSALLVADVLVIPVLPSQLDAWALDFMDDIVGEAAILNNTVRVIAVMNKTDTNPKVLLPDETTDLASKLQNISISKIQIRNRIAFRKSIADGMAVNELKSKNDPKAIQEINNLYKEIFQNQ